MGGLWRTFAVLMLLGLAGIGVWRFAIGWHPSRESYPVQGIDVSAANGAVDWGGVSGVADFGYAVATIGADQRDAAFEANWHGIAEAGMRRGAIHRYSLCQLAVDQANAFNTVVPRDTAALPAAVEIGYDPACAARPDRTVLIRELARFMTMVEAHTGKPMLIRIARRVDADYALSAALPRSIWAIGSVFPPDYAARPWRMWQASDFRQIEGVEGAVHWDVAAP